MTNLTDIINYFMVKLKNSYSLSSNLDNVFNTMSGTTKIIFTYIETPFSNKTLARKLINLNIDIQTDQDINIVLDEIQNAIRDFNTRDFSNITQEYLLENENQNGWSWYSGSGGLGATITLTTLTLDTVELRTEPPAPKKTIHTRWNLNNYVNSILSVTEAKLKLTPNETDSVTNAILSGVDVDDEDVVEATAYVTTTARVVASTALTIDTEIELVATSVIQEITDRSGFNKGHLVLFYDDHTAGGDDVNFYGLDSAETNDSDKLPKLEVTYTYTKATNLINMKYIHSKEEYNKSTQIFTSKIILQIELAT